MLRRLLEGAGHAVSEAEHGAAALLLIAETLPDLVMTDMMMPVMDGREFVSRLRADARTAALPIVIVSSQTDLAALPVQATVSKPFALSEVLDAVADVSKGAQP